MRMYILIIFLLFAAIYPVSADESQDILEKIDTYRIPYEEFLVRTKITSLEHDKAVETAIFDVYICGKEKSLVLAREYKTRGMKILYVDENMWVHFPGTHRPIRITPIQRLMGEASNGDIARVSLSGDYSPKILGNETVNGISCHKILLTARKKSATYNKIILCARIPDFRAVKAEFYLLSGKHFKTAFYEEFIYIDGQPTLSRMTIYDEIKKWKRTTFEYVHIEEKALPVKYFNKNYLIHIKGL